MLVYVLNESRLGGLPKYEENYGYDRQQKIENRREEVSGVKKKVKKGDQMIYVKGGTFVMGQSDPDIGGKGGSNDEQPRHVG
jgi:formylglycine-generating enzyme required for sulfatase activity